MSRSGYWAWVGLLAAAAAMKAVAADTLDPDCFWHLRVADQLVRDGIGPVVDHISFASRSDPWTPYSWGAELGMRAVWRAGGYRAALATQAAMQAAFVVLLGLACDEGRRWRTDRDGAAVAVALGVVMSLPYLSFRPVTLALVGLAACGWLTVRSRRTGGRCAWGVVPIAVGMANVHLYALLLPGAAAAWWMGERRRAWFTTPWARSRRGEPRTTSGSEVVVVRGRPMAAEAATPVSGWWVLCVAVASVATPMLPGLVRTAVFYSTSDAMVAGPVIAEMRPWGRDGFSILVLVGISVGLWRAGRAVPIGVWVWVGVTTALTLTLGRFAPVLAVAACPAVAAGVGGGSAVSRRPVRWAVAGLTVLCLGRVAVAFPRPGQSLSGWLNRLGPDVPGYPCAACDYVESRVNRRTGRVVNEFTWGGYLGWRLGGRYQVLLDGRTQVFPGSLWRATYLGSPDTCRAFLAGVSADAAVVPVRGSRFRAALVGQGWRTAFRDEWAEVLIPPIAVTDASR